MPIELKSGIVLPIPCRNCGKILRFVFVDRPEGSSLTCASCAMTTVVATTLEPGGWKVRTFLALGAGRT